MLLNYLNFSIFFLFLSFIMIITYILVIGSKNPIHVILSLITLFFEGSFFFIFFDIEVFSLNLLIVYIGAISVLFLFVILILNIKKEINSNFIYLGFGFLSVFIGLIFIIFYLNLFNLLLLDWTREIQEVSQTIQENNNNLLELLEKLNTKISINYEAFDKKVLKSLDYYNLFKLDDSFKNKNKQLIEFNNIIKKSNIKNIINNIIYVNNFYLDFSFKFKEMFSSPEINNDIITIEVLKNLNGINIDNKKSLEFWQNEVKQNMLDLFFKDIIFFRTKIANLIEQSKLTYITGNIINFNLDFIILKKNYEDFFADYLFAKENLYNDFFNKIKKSNELCNIIYNFDIYEQIMKNNISLDIFNFFIENQKIKLKKDNKFFIDFLKTITIKKFDYNKIELRDIDLTMDNFIKINSRIKIIIENYRQLMDIYVSPINKILLEQKQCINKYNNLQVDFLLDQRRVIEKININVKNENEILTNEILIVKNENLILKNEILNLQNEKIIPEAEILNNINLEQENNEEIPVNNKFYNFIKDTINFINKGINKGIKIVKSFFTIFI